MRSTVGCFFVERTWYPVEGIKLLWQYAFLYGKMDAFIDCLTDLHKSAM